MNIKIKFTQDELKLRSAKILGLDRNLIDCVYPCMKGKAFLVTFIEGEWSCRGYKSTRQTKTISIWDMVNTLPLDTVQAKVDVTLIESIKQSLDYLGLTSYPDPKKLKQAFRKKAKESHPDKGGSSEDFIRIKEAYKILKSYSETFFVNNL